MTRSPLTDAQPDYADKVGANEWHPIGDLKAVLEVIKSIGPVPSKGWHWSLSRSWRCKYIHLQIDMRDGGFTLSDRDGFRISPDELRYQKAVDA